MKTLKTIACLAVLACGAVQLSAADIFTYNNLNLAIPDGQPTGLSDVESVSSAITHITSVQVTLDIAGNFNGDLYAYLQHGSQIAILLNRPGRTASNPDGYADSGFQITLSDTASSDIHNYESILTPGPNTPLTGLWQPDGRDVDPALVLDTDPRTDGLGVFNGMDANGTWTLFVADMSSGGTNMLTGWQLTVVPEPSTMALLLLGAGVAAWRVRRGKCRP